MARPECRLPENAPGEFYVDSSCIDCATCRNVADGLFAYSRAGRSFVARQPVTAAERQRALMAVVACPTASIGAAGRTDARAGVESFPERVHEDVYYCGFAARRSYGASSYLLVRPTGNVMVDSPRAAAPLLRRLQALGGVDRLFLTHRDDVADHALFRRRFGCERVLHEDDVSAETADVERRLSGREPSRLAADLLAIPVPGHTAGSTVLLYRDTFLFTGDHLMGTEDGRALYASRSVCWFSWAEQVRSMERLLDYRFEWVLPGHGTPFRAGNAEAMRAELERLLQRMRRR
jgi:glyoxylase-like metal-dependent hydrolase (beta-lactamase superfamily II)/ferredoxin